MKKIDTYIVEKLRINKNTKTEEIDFVLLEARNLHLYQTWENKYQFIMTSQAQFHRLFIIDSKTADGIIKVNSKTCYWMYEWPSIFKIPRELQDAFTHNELRLKDLNTYSEFERNGKL